MGFSKPLFVAAIAWGSVACGSGEATPQAPKPLPTVQATAPDEAKRVAFSFADLTGKEVSTDSMHGRTTVIAFIATYDAASQAETRFLLEVARDHVPRINAFALVLESAENQPLADAFAHALHLNYPLCMADEATIRGEGPFAGMNQIPSVIILDKDGRERWRRVGLVQKAELEEAIRGVEGAKRGL